MMSEPAYHHTQKAPWFLLLFAFAALFFTVAWVTRAEPVVPVILLVSGLLMAVLGYSVQQLTACDEGNWLAIRFGPLPLFKRRIRYDDILEIEIGRTTIMDGWGIEGANNYGTPTPSCVGFRNVPAISLADHDFRIILQGGSQRFPSAILFLKFAPKFSPLEMQQGGNLLHEMRKSLQIKDLCAVSAKRKPA